ncbi:hypothetical protein LINGRAHAP2_LOCUS28799 [Linum grandiflorum]
MPSFPTSVSFHLHCSTARGDHRPFKSLLLFDVKFPRLLFAVKMKMDESLDGGKVYIRSQSGAEYLRSFFALLFTLRR